VGIPKDFLEDSLNTSQTSLSSQPAERFHAHREASHAGSSDTTNGIPFGRVIQAEVRTDIYEHLRNEQSELAAQCGLRRASSPRRALGRPGRPKRAISVVLAYKLEPFLLDETWSLKDVAELFQLSIGVVRAYMEWLGVTRSKGRKRGQ
jgi:hypothetical protein